MRETGGNKGAQLGTATGEFLRRYDVVIRIPKPPKNLFPCARDSFSGPKRRLRWLRSMRSSCLRPVGAARAITCDEASEAALCGRHLTGVGARGTKVHVLRRYSVDIGRLTAGKEDKIRPTLISTGTDRGILSPSRGQATCRVVHEALLRGPGCARKMRT